MAISSDTLLERLHLRRKLVFWRLCAISIAIFFSVIYFESGESTSPITGEFIARVTIEGIIEDDRKMLEMLDDVRDDDQVKAVVLWMNTPGGTTMGGEAIHDKVLEIKKKKPVVVVMRTLCASAGYMIASAADQIFSGETTLTGSIGVLLQSGEVTELAKKIGIEPIVIKSGPNKAAPSFVEKFTPEQRAVLQGTMEDSFEVFKEMVSKGRGMSMEEVNALSDGRIYTGREAVKNKLVDAIGDEESAQAWLEKEKNVTKSLAIRDVKPKKDDHDSFWQRMLDTTGLAKIYPRSLQLDGLLSIWQPAL